MLFQSTSSSSATSIGIAVITPCPISTIDSMMRTELSVPMRSQTFGSKEAACAASSAAGPPVSGDGR
jgi:hypothetical protein